MGLGLVVSAVTGYLCIHVLLKFIARFGLLSIRALPGGARRLIVLMLG